MKNKKQKPAPPNILSPKLEADMMAFMKKHLDAGRSTKSAIKITHRRFSKVINRELTSNPEAKLRLQKHMRREALSQYRWYVRILIRAAALISRFIKKPKPHGT